MRWFTVDHGETTAEIDEKGNTNLFLSEKGTEGVFVSVPSGSMRLKIGGQQNLDGTGGEFIVSATRNIKMSGDGQVKIFAKRDLGIRAEGRAEISVSRGIVMRSDGSINIDAKPHSGINLGSRDKDKYPVLVGQPEYLSTLNNVWSNITSLAGSLATYGGNAASAWASVGPLLMILDQSGTVMGLCLSAGQAAGQIAASAPQVSSSIGQHLPRLAQMPSGFLSSKTVSE